MRKENSPGEKAKHMRVVITTDITHNSIVERRSSRCSMNGFVRELW
jgi:hypothetical protein